MPQAWRLGRDRRLRRGGRDRVAIIVAIRPWLQRIALAKPNARSSHTVPTPQGGGIAVIAATIIAAAGALSLSASAASAAASLLPLLVAVIVIAAVGAADDIRPIGVAPRFFLQAFSVALVIFALPDELRVAPFMPVFIERLLLTVGGLWFVNLVNFMDGLDWMTVAEVVPVTAALAIFGAFGFLPATQTIISLALCGAMIGFAYFNRPVAKLFLGDVGSLPIGLLLGWLLVQLAGHGALAAAILLPLYYLADATITLVRRLIAGEKVWQAHRSHFYQRATDRGFTVSQVARRPRRPGGRDPVATLLSGSTLTITLVRRLIAGEKVWQAHRSHFYQRATDRGFTVIQVAVHVFAVNLGLAALAFFTLSAPGLLNDAVALVLRRGSCRLAVAGVRARSRGGKHARRALSLRRVSAVRSLNLAHTRARLWADPSEVSGIHSGPCRMPRPSPMSDQAKKTPTRPSDLLEPVQAGKTAATSGSWAEYLVLFLRFMAGVSLVKGLYHWRRSAGSGRRRSEALNRIRPPGRRRQCSLP